MRAFFCSIVQKRGNNVLLCKAKAPHVHSAHLTRQGGYFFAMQFFFTRDMSFLFWHLFFLFPLHPWRNSPAAVDTGRWVVICRVNKCSYETFTPNAVYPHHFYCTSTINIDHYNRFRQMNIFWHLDEHSYCTPVPILLSAGAADKSIKLTPTRNMPLRPPSFNWVLRRGSRV